MELSITSRSFFNSKPRINNLHVASALILYAAAAAAVASLRGCSFIWRQIHRFCTYGLFDFIVGYLRFTLLLSILPVCLMATSLPVIS